MLYNSKKLIDEKVFQQFFFERFMTASRAERLRLLPARFARYAHTHAVKVLQPEVRLCPGFHVDFILHSTRGWPPLNIELKWSTSDFLRQKTRHRWFDGSKGLGFLVALAGNDLPPGIPAVILDWMEFRDWFVAHSRDLLSQALYRKLGSADFVGDARRYWLIYLGDKSREHYEQVALRQGLWAFKDRESPRNIMRMRSGDYLVFVRSSFCKPSRMYVAADEPSKAERTSVRNHRIWSNTDVDWALEAVDIVELTEGYHLDLGGRSPYDAFESAEWRRRSTPNSKQYTQFVRFAVTGSPRTTGRVPYRWAECAPIGALLPRD